MKIYQNLDNIFKSFSEKTKLDHSIRMIETKTRISFCFSFNIANGQQISDFNESIRPYLKDLPFKNEISFKYVANTLSYKFEKSKLRNHIKYIQTLEKSLTAINKFSL